MDAGCGDKVASAGRGGDTIDGVVITEAVCVEIPEASAFDVEDTDWTLSVLFRLSSEDLARSTGDSLLLLSEAVAA